MNRSMKKNENGEKGYPVIGVICLIIAAVSLGIVGLIFSNIETQIVLVLTLPVLCFINMALAAIVLYRKDSSKTLPLIGLIITISITVFLAFHLYVIFSETGRLFHHINDWSVPL